MSKHTPGPWRYGEASNYCGFYIAPEKCMPTLAAVERPRGSRETINVMAYNFPGQTEANARLIAAAPDMFDALKSIAATLPHLDCNPHSINSMLRAATAAIKKAEAAQ